MNWSDTQLDEHAERCAQEMAAAWQSGQRITVEQFFQRYPEIENSSEHAVRLIFEEVCLRLECGEQVDPRELKRRFACRYDQLILLLDFEQLMQSFVTPPSFPEVGQTLGEFQLVSELGRGQHSCVYLATQPTLADRPVVLKVIPPHADESQWLAQLQHTNIIPLYTVVDFPERNLRALVQPYLGGATLQHVLDALGDVPIRERTGANIVAAIDAAAAAAPIALPAKSGWHDELKGMSYADAVCWIGANLAAALQFAHEHGLVHLDVKPSNVLLATDCQPLLLDFHLAVRTIPAGTQVTDRIGGTLAFMSPEQKLAYDAAKELQPAPRTVDQRTDVYALGCLMYVALGGSLEELSHPQSLRLQNPQVSQGLSDIIQRAMTQDTERRYPSAKALGEDLERHLLHRPLVGVRNRSWNERWQKWRQRRPAAILWLTLALAFLVMSVTLGLSVVERVQEAKTSLKDAQQQIARREFGEAAQRLERNIQRLAVIPGFSALKESMNTQLSRAERGRAARALHVAAERTRLLSGAGNVTPSELGSLRSDHDRALQAKTLLTNRQELGLDATTERQIVDDLAELESTQAEFAHEPPVRGVASAPPADPVRRGRQLLRAGLFAEAQAAFQEAIRAKPGDFWPHFYQGVCAHRLGKFDDAAQSFTVAIALAPQLAEVYFNRALDLAAAGNLAAARADYDRALELKPTLAVAALNRGVLNFQERRFDAAVADLELALKNGAAPAAVNYNLALVRQAQGNIAEARRYVESALGSDPQHKRAQILKKTLDENP